MNYFGFAYKCTNGRVCLCNTNGNGVIFRRGEQRGIKLMLRFMLFSGSCPAVACLLTPGRFVPVTYLARERVNLNCICAWRIVCSPRSLHVQVTRVVMELRDVKGGGSLYLILLDR